MTRIEDKFGRRLKRSQLPQQNTRRSKIFNPADMPTWWFILSAILLAIVVDVVLFAVIVRLGLITLAHADERPIACTYVPNPNCAIFGPMQDDPPYACRPPSECRFGPPLWLDNPLAHAIRRGRCLLETEHPTDWGNTRRNVWRNRPCPEHDFEAGRFAK